MRNAIDPERLVRAGPLRLALWSVFAFVLHIVWIPAHLAFETHLHHGVDPLAALAHGGLETSHPHAPGEHRHEHGHNHVGEREHSPAQPDGHEPHPASDHDADLLVVRSSVAPFVLAPPPSPCVTVSIRPRASGLFRACLPHAPGGRPADPHATRGPPAA